MRLRDMSKGKVEDLQRDLNAFTRRFRLRGFPPLRVDGAPGPATRRRLRWVRFFLGYAGPASKQSLEITERFQWRLTHPKRIRPNTKDRPLVTRGARRRVAERARWRREHITSFIAPGVTRWEGMPVAKVAVPYLNFARRNGWRGRLNSGWRSIAYSISLCIRICGAPRCPGRCAGALTNHVGIIASRFALDVSFYDHFGQLMRRSDAPQPRIFNALGAQDPVHFSPSGR